MFDSFRGAMSWLHTWFGLVLGFVLLVVFFFGSLSVFDREIDRWAVPETRFEPQVMPSFDTVLRPVFERLEPDASEVGEARNRVRGSLEPVLPLMNWSAYTTHRDPVLEMYAEFAVRNNPENPLDHVHGHVTLDPRSGTTLPHDRLRIGTEFFYPLHFGLHMRWRDLGYWIVGIAALVMMAALVSGVVIHRKIFRELFTFRPELNAQRILLDLHNLTGVLTLPLLFAFPLTGLIVFANIYLPISESTLAPLAQQQQRAEALARHLPLAPSGVKTPLSSVDAMVSEAKRRWAQRGTPGEVGYLIVNHVGDADGYVSVFRAGTDRVSLIGQGVHFAAATGRVLYEEPPPSAIMGMNDFLAGLHLQHFEHWVLRWSYLLGGLFGCVCIATGLVFFVGKRRRRHAEAAHRGVCWVEALTVASVTGMLMATLALLVANRALPPDLVHRSEWERGAFWASWLIALVHAAFRSTPAHENSVTPAWCEQCFAVCVLASCAAVLNWVTTGDHLLRTVARGYWPVAGMDLALLTVSMAAALVAWRLKREKAEPQRSPSQFLTDVSQSAHG